MGYVTKAGLCRRLSRRVNITASRNPVKAPRNASEIERLLKVRRPWPVRRNPAQARVTVQKIARLFKAFTARSIPNINAKCSCPLEDVSRPEAACLRSQLWQSLTVENRNESLKSFQAEVTPVDDPVRFKQRDAR